MSRTGRSYPLGLDGLKRVNAEMVGFVQSHLGIPVLVEVDMDATLVETQRSSQYQPLSTYWAKPIRSCTRI